MTAKAMKAEFKPSDLPPMPQVVAKIIQIDENNIDISADQIQSLISVDPALTSKILKMANSAFYARSSKVANLSQAVTLLGFKTIKSLTLLVSSKDMFPTKKGRSNVQKELWMRSVLGALVSKIVAEKMGQRGLQEEVFMSALLKNIGRLILHNKDSVLYEKIFSATENLTDFMKASQLELGEFGISSSQVSSMTMQKWNFPDAYVKVAQSKLDQVDKVAEECAEIGLIANMAELIVLIADFTHAGKLTDDRIEALRQLFDVYANKLSLPDNVKEYIANELESQIKGDDFYSFCMELFAS